MLQFISAIIVISGLWALAFYGFARPKYRVVQIAGRYAIERRAWFDVEYLNLTEPGAHFHPRSSTRFESCLSDDLKSVNDKYELHIAAPRAPDIT